MRAVIYTRVSSDPKGRGRSVTEQQAECEAVCARERWSVVATLSDNDRSASRHAKRSRPEWDQVQQLIADGAADVLVTWEASRAQRDLAAYTKLRDLCARHRVSWCYGGKLYDLDDRDDRFRTGLDALLSEDESERTRSRVKRAMAANASSGRPHGRRLYGYQRVYDPQSGELVGQEPQPDEAPIVVEIITRVLAGESLRTLAADLNARAVPTSTSRPWSTTTVRRIAVNPAYAALRVHRGEIAGPASWPPIVTVDEHTVAVARMTDPSRRITRQRERAHLLSGVARCGRCGGPMTRGHDRRKRNVYTCRSLQHLTIGQEALDAFVTTVVLERLARPDGLPATTASAPDEVLHARRELDDLRSRLDDAADQYTAGKISASMLAKVEARITNQITSATKRARFAALPTTVSDLVGARDVSTVWDALTIEQQVEVVRALVEITVKPSSPTRTFQPERVLIEWRV